LGSVSRFHLALILAEANVADLIDGCVANGPLVPQLGTAVRRAPVGRPGSLTAQESVVQAILDPPSDRANGESSST
jgi:hypothetical protein